MYTHHLNDKHLRFKSPFEQRTQHGVISVTCVVTHIKWQAYFTCIKSINMSIHRTVENPEGGRQLLL